ncbi:hypothetical protein EDB83DRAFT_2317181 [Lactarius deliciosus]|nr:hypothetical protein EDB83DRAFT_2317181 [Lactarius deliciosus]
MDKLASQVCLNWVAHILRTGSIRVGATLPVHFENYKMATVFAGSWAQAQPPLYPRREHLSWRHAGFENYKTATAFARSMGPGCTVLRALAGSTGVGEDSEVGTDALPMMRGIYVLDPYLAYGYLHTWQTGLPQPHP